MDRVRNKVAIVTGGAVGIGRSASTLLAREGACVAVTDIRLEEGRELVSRIRGEGFRAGFWELDVSDAEQVDSVFLQVAEAFGPITVLVNNAGIAGPNKPTDEISEQEWDALMAVNVKGTFFCTRAAIRYMREAGGGSIINLSSVYGMVGAGDAPPYHVSKAANWMQARNDALIYAPDNIRVNSIHPGFIRTPMLERAAEETPGGAQALFDMLAAKHPLGRVGEPDDIGWAIVYLASDEARFVTGSALVVDGGYTAQ